MTPTPYDKIRYRVDSTMPPEAILAACDAMKNGRGLEANLDDRKMTKYVTAEQIDALLAAMERIER